MDRNLLKKSIISLSMITTAGFYYGQKKPDTVKVKDVEEVVLVGRNLTSVAKERKTPVAISTIKASEIQDKLGNREFPEIVKSTPSVYATKTGGGFGDGRINIRGFEQTNIAVLINGQPVNDMENGAVYWSNWSGLGDIANSIQIQRGLGASKLVVPSVGGTFNIVTKSTDKAEGGVLKLDLANNNFSRFTAGYNTGIGKSGWATSVLLSRWQGDGYINGTKGEGYTWFFSTGYKLNEKHQFNFMATGAPQIHNTRRATVTGLGSAIVTIDALNKYGIKYNPQTGILKGEEFNVSPNFYHKPIASLNWDYQISDKLKASTVIYGSWGRGGGGSGLAGSIRNAANQTMDFVNDGLGGDGTINWDMVYNYNSGQTVVDYNGNTFTKPAFTAPAGAPTVYNGTNTVTFGGTNGIVRRQGVNSHNWYGGIVDLNYKVNSNWNVNGGIDLRTYRGIHYDIITDLLGAKAAYVASSASSVKSNTFIDTVVQPSPLTDLENNQKVTYDNDGVVRWGGLYGQVEYSANNLSAFFQGSISQQAYRREDRMAVTGDKAISDFDKRNGYIVKTGANYNIDSHHNVFFNVGKISRQPYFNAIFQNNKQIASDITNEIIQSAELGYGFKSRIIDINLNIYRTQWDNRFLTRSFTANATDAANYQGLISGNSYAFNSVGLGQLHQGFEFEAKARPFKGFTARAMFSYGDWKYNGDAKFDFIDNLTNLKVNENQYNLNVDGLKVGDAAQTTSSIGFDYNFYKGFYIDANYEYYDNLYAQFNPTFFTTKAEKDKGVIQLPSYQLFDVGASYKWKMSGKSELNFRANIYNLFDTKYLSEVLTNNRLKTQADFSTTDAYNNYMNNNTFKGIDTSNRGFFGFGRTWGFNVAYRF